MLDMHGVADSNSAVSTKIVKNHQVCVNKLGGFLFAFDNIFDAFYDSFGLNCAG